MYAKAEKESEEKDIQINTATAKSETSNIYHKNNIKSTNQLILISIISITTYILIPKTYGYQKEVITVFKEKDVYDNLKENNRAYNKNERVGVKS